MKTECKHSELREKSDSRCIRIKWIFLTLSQHYYTSRNKIALHYFTLNAPDFAYLMSKSIKNSFLLMLNKQM